MKNLMCKDLVKQMANKVEKLPSGIKLGIALSVVPIVSVIVISKLALNNKNRIIQNLEDALESMEDEIFDLKEENSYLQ